MNVEKHMEIMISALPGSFALVAIVLSVILGLDRQRLAWVLVLAALPVVVIAARLHAEKRELFGAILLARYLATLVWCAAAWGAGRLMWAGASGVRRRLRGS
jgi:hypothetical protein